MAQALDERARPTPANLGLRVPDAVERAFEKALTVDPTQRTGSIKEFWTLLELAANRPPSLRAARPQAPLPSREPHLPSLMPSPPAAPIATAPGEFGVNTRAATDLGPELPNLAATTEPLGAAKELDPASSPAPRSQPVVEHRPASVREPSRAARSAPRAAAAAPLSLEGPLVVDRPRPRPAKPGIYGEVGMLDRGTTSSDLSARFSGPAKLVALAILVGAITPVARAVGFALPSLGPVKLVWIAGLLGIWGVALGVARLIRDA
jgi:hypothetical protein